MDETKYTLVDHLTELRKRIIYCLICFGIASAFSWPLIPFVIQHSSAPGGRLVFLHPTEAFITYFKVCLWIGFFLSLPLIFYNIWKYVEKGLSEKEKQYVLLFAPGSFVLFLLGAVFGYFLAIPIAIKFLIGFGQGMAEPMLSIGEYISFIGWMLVAFGASFELPLIVFFLAKLKIVNVASLKRLRKQAILFIFIIAAIITPTPDAFSQILLAIPLIILYELGILLSRWA